MPRSPIKQGLQLPELPRLFLSMTRLVHGEMKKIGGKSELSASQAQAMLVVTCRQSVRLGDLAECLGMSAPSATVLVNGLVRKGYLERVADPSDGRALHLHPTAPGKRAIEKRLTLFSQAFQQLLTSLTRKEQSDLAAILHKLVTLHEPALH